MPLAVCLLALLTLTDRFLPSLLWIEPDPADRAVLGTRRLYQGVVEGPARWTESGLKVTVANLASMEGESLRGRALLTVAEPEGPIPGRGDRVRFAARLKRPTRYKNPGSFDFRRYLRRRGVLYTAYLEPPESLEVLRTEGRRGGFDRWRERIRAAIGAASPGEGGALLEALLLGDAARLTKETRSDLRAAGVSHLTAVSGQHIAIAGFAAFCCFLWLFRRSERLLLSASGRRLALAAALLPMTAYVLLAGSPPSAVRAFILASLVVLAALLNRFPDGLSSLAAAAVVIGIADPAAPFTASYQLSFLAVLGIILFRPQPTAREGLRKTPAFLRRFVVNPFWMTAGATVMTAPVVAYRFHEVSLSGLFVNLAAIPAVGVLLIAGLASVLAASAWPALGLVLLKGAGFLSGYFLQGVHAVAGWSRGANLVASFYPTEFEVVLSFAAVALAAWLRRRRGVPLFLHPRAMLAGIVAVALVVAAFQGRARAFLEVVFLDVGEGDAALVRTPGGQSLLVDGGGFLVPQGDRQAGFDVGREVVVPYLKRRGLTRVDAVLLSHPHPDHFGGLAAVVEAFPVGEFWWNGQLFPDASFDRLKQALEDGGVAMKTLKDGDVFPWSGTLVEVMYPDAVRSTRNINDNSLVVRVHYGDFRILFPGDIEKEGERALADVRDIGADVLKVPHHGSRTSSSVPFIDEVHPAVAVASLGEDNLFGFPHEGVLEKYERRGVRVLRTDRDGAVTIRLFPGSPKRSPAIRTFFSGE